MEFGLINGNRAKAVKGYKGTCAHCGAELIAKCGERKIHHWAHKANRNGDPWWESETEWHRRWKDNYSEDWREFQLRDEATNEEHIADVRTNHGLVIEFQHSNINPNERIAREKFYKYSYTSSEDIFRILASVQLLKQALCRSAGQHSLNSVSYYKPLQ